MNSICESRHRAEVALELRNNFDSLQNLWIHSFLITLALLCNFLLLSLPIKDLTFLVPGLCSFFFFFFGHTTGLAGSDFPDHGSNQCPLQGMCGVLTTG